MVRGEQCGDEPVAELVVMVMAASMTRTGCPVKAQQQEMSA
ncbi:hypothetical protein ABT369_56395 [Dactylosporangium sp. NPDC000244]